MLISKLISSYLLQDVLHNSSLKLDWMFQMAMAFDIARVSWTYTEIESSFVPKKFQLSHALLCEHNLVYVFCRLFKYFHFLNVIIL